MVCVQLKYENLETIIMIGLPFMYIIIFLCISVTMYLFMYVSDSVSDFILLTPFACFSILLFINLTSTKYCSF